MSYFPKTRIGQRAARRPFTPRQSPKPMDIPIISREAMRKNVSRIAIETGCGIEAAIRQYAETINFTEEALREVFDFVEETAS